jgi:hypothetical protein
MTPRELEAQATGYQTSIVILAANRLGILPALCKASLTPEALADSLGLDRRATGTLCDALACLGVAVRDEGRMRVPEELRAALDPESPASLTQIFDHHWHLVERWARLDEVVRSGQPIPRPRQDEEQRRAFILGMADLARRGAAALWDGVSLNGRRHLVDVGGGPGEYALSALERFPGLRATVFDLPEVLEIAREYADGRPPTDRLSTRPGDALQDDIPACDVALVSALVHSYGPDDVRRIADHVAAGVEPGGQVLIREFLWDDEAHTGPLSAALFAVNMMVGTREGRCWTAEELETIFGEAGFGDWSILRLDPRNTVLVGSRMPDPPRPR